MKKEINLKGNNFIDLFKALEGHEDEYIYYKTDHHWSTTGAWYAYEAFSKAAGFNPVQEEELEKAYSGKFFGTFYAASPKEAGSEDLIWYYPALEGKDKYALFLHNNPGKVLVRSDAQGAKNGKRLLVFKDSYANSVIPFLTSNYQEIQVVDLRYYNASSKEIMKEEWDEVLFMFNFTFFSEDPNLVKLKY